MPRVPAELLAAAGLLIADPARVLAGDAVDGAALVQRFECARCHEGLTGPAPPADKRCVGCHREIVDGRFAAAAPLLARWQRNLTSLRQVPSLSGVGDRLTRAWVTDFLRQPHDVRPALAATMPRLPFGPREAEAVAAFLVPREAAPTTFAAAAAQAGRRLYQRMGCGTCHRFTGAGVAGSRAVPVGRGRGAAAPPDGLALAPDLAVTRRRFQSGRLQAWLADPQHLQPGTAMPASGLPPAEVEALAAFVMTAPLLPSPQAAPPPRLPPLRRPVRWAEVEAQVFRQTCWHCHAEPDLARGDGGPGNTGGFGFPARRLDLSSYEGALSGALGPDGRRHSVLAPGPGGQPPSLLQSLLARQREEHGLPASGVRGMPLGLPALSPRQVQLVESWIAQGRRL